MAARHTRIVDRAVSRLKLRQLRLLVAVGQFGSIQNVARDLQISQPAATKLIQDLELDFEVKLFQRAAPGGEGIEERLILRVLNIPIPVFDQFA